jgi:hypothetical protein
MMRNDFFLTFTLYSRLMINQTLFIVVVELGYCGDEDFVHGGD